MPVVLEAVRMTLSSTVDRELVTDLFASRSMVQRLSLSTVGVFGTPTGSRPLFVHESGLETPRDDESGRPIRNVLMMAVVRLPEVRQRVFHDVFHY